ncbi:hypothetical protein PI124_g17613 [Phytophthora idaei]|nr:hypothetical protein PI125_g15172 [Phytophthora idaei]KAG3237394.1 hypothetical protein PI124_g17613 [Phytophthora idaei]
MRWVVGCAAAGCVRPICIVCGWVAWNEGVIEADEDDEYHLLSSDPRDARPTSAAAPSRGNFLFGSSDGSDDDDDTSTCTEEIDNASEAKDDNVDEDISDTEEESVDDDVADDAADEDSQGGPNAPAAIAECHFAEQFLTSLGGAGNVLAGNVVGDSLY